MKLKACSGSLAFDARLRSGDSIAADSASGKEPCESRPPEVAGGRTVHGQKPGMAAGTAGGFGLAGFIGSLIAAPRVGKANYGRIAAGLQFGNVPVAGAARLAQKTGNVELVVGLFGGLFPESEPG